MTDRDISNFGGTILKAIFLDMYTKQFKPNPSAKKIYLNSKTLQGDYLTRSKYQLLLNIWIRWRNAHGGVRPNYITINKVNPPIKKVGAIQGACEKTLGKTFTIIKDFCNDCRGRGYSFYEGDVYNLKREELLRNINCADATQLLVQLAREMGYEARYCHVYCKKSGGHIYAELRGKELGTTWIRVDLAAMLSKATKAQFGHGWCFDVPISSYNDPWLVSDNGKS
jgi:hypothetical protein